MKEKICVCGHKKTDHLAKIFPGTCGHGNCKCFKYKEKKLCKSVEKTTQ